MASFGESLKREREQREISLRQISEATKINIRYLEALEENRFDALPGGLFNKGFIRAYATYIGIDGEAMVNSYLHELSVREPGADTTGDRNHPQLHRPVEVPQRRSARRPGDAMRDRPALRTIPPGSPPPQSAGSGRPEGRAATGATTGEPVPLDNLERLQAARPTVTGIEAVDKTAPRSSRVLVWILSLVAAAGVLFLVLSLLRGTTPPSSRPALGPAAPDNGGAQTGASDLLPEMSSPAPITLGALDAPRTKAPAGEPSPAATRAPAPARAERPASPPATGAGPREEPPTAPGSEARGPMDVALEVRGRTFVQLLCDGHETVSRVMEAGEIARAQCLGVVRVSSADAGAARLSVNGSPCLPLGDPGTRAFGYTIRIDDYARICPATGRGADARP